MSPDMKYLMSGDSEGKAYFWEWTHPNKVRGRQREQRGGAVVTASRLAPSHPARSESL